MTQHKTKLVPCDHISHTTNGRNHRRQRRVLLRPSRSVMMTWLRSIAADDSEPRRRGLESCLEQQPTDTSSTTSRELSPRRFGLLASRVLAAFAMFTQTNQQNKKIRVAKVVSHFTIALHALSLPDLALFRKSFSSRGTLKRTSFVRDFSQTYSYVRKDSSGQSLVHLLLPEVTVVRTN